MDSSQGGLSEWTFMTIYSWGENPAGVWSLEVRDNPFTVGSCLRQNVYVAGYLTQVTLTLFGTYQARLIKRERADRMKTSAVMKKQELGDIFQNDQTRLQIVKAFLDENLKKVDENDILPDQDNVMAVEERNGETALRHQSSILDDVNALLKDIALRTQEAEGRQ
ncbi:neuroendocrine convertase 2-like [Protopterus annectens]|uniref:neuroendocrine convertase 2-like n=1 Tax=Protopterus annectens TaxID=7888 RepID=UPI001CFABC1D|nr:neuroendocrine convertase 2-like [Protopterus annectens]